MVSNMDKMVKSFNSNINYNTWENSAIRNILFKIYSIFEKIIYKILDKLQENSLIFSFLNYLSQHIAIILGLSLVVIGIVPDGLWSNLYLYIMVFGLWVLNIYNREGKIKIAFDDFLVLFILSVLMATVFSIHPKLSIKYAINYIFVFIFYSVFINNLKTSKDLFKIITAITIATLLVSFYGLLQKFVIGVAVNLSQTDMSISQELSGRVYSTMGNPNVLGEYFLLTIPLIVTNFLCNENKYIKALSAITILLSMFVLLTTGSRSAWASFVVCVVVYILLYKPKYLPVLFMLGLISFFFMPSTIQTRVVSMFNKSDSSINYRKYIYESANLMRKDFQFIGGVGLGNEVFQGAFESYKVAALSTVAHCHNLYLQLTIEMGIFGLLFLILHILKLILESLTDIFNNSVNTNIKLVQIACISSICGFMLMSVADYTWFYLRIVAMFFIVLAILKKSRKLNIN